jgi:hypothetical protein
MYTQRAENAKTIKHIQKQLYNTSGSTLVVSHAVFSLFAAITFSHHLLATYLAFADHLPI